MDDALLLACGALERWFPELAPIQPVGVLGEGFESVVVETAGRLVFKLAKTSEAASCFEGEAALLVELAPRLPVAVPIPGWLASNNNTWPYGVLGYRKLPGSPLPARKLRPRHAVRVGHSVGRFLAVLHGVQRATMITQLPTTTVRETLSAEFCSTVREVIAQSAGSFKAEALDSWLASTPILGDKQASSVLCHGDAWYDNLLVLDGEVVGVLDWSNASWADPAYDFAPLQYNGSAYLTAACGAYAEVAGVDPVALAHRSAEHLLLRELSGLHRAITSAPEEIPDALHKVSALLPHHE
jgi:aminoglycoside 2''-phosphotransferase